MRAEARRRIFTAARVTLRRPAIGDGDEVIDMNHRSKKLHRPWVYPLLDKPIWTRYVQRLESERHHGSLVCLRDTGAIVGVINISEVVQGPFQSAYLGCYAGQPYAGLGYMTEGLELVLGFGFNRLELPILATKAPCFSSGDEFAVLRAAESREARL